MSQNFNFTKPKYLQYNRLTTQEPYLEFKVTIALLNQNELN